MMSVFSGALCLLIFFCAQRLFGPTGGLISETIAVFDPNLLAHGALVTSDIPAAFFFTAAVWSTWRLLHHVSPGTLTLQRPECRRTFSHEDVRAVVPHYGRNLERVANIFCRTD